MRQTDWFALRSEPEIGPATSGRQLAARLLDSRGRKRFVQVGCIAALNGPNDQAIIDRSLPERYTKPRRRCDLNEEYYRRRRRLAAASL